MTQTKSPATQARPGEQVSDSNRTKVPAKWHRVLAAFLEGKTFNRFEAERELHDHCLPSTVSTLERKGVRIWRRWEQVPGFCGIRTDCCRYRLNPDPENAQRAGALLGHTEGPPTSHERPWARSGKPVEHSEWAR